MSKANAIIKFLNAARSLADQGLSKEAIMQFARNEFGEINELFQKQIDNIFKPKQGIENIKIKDEVFDDTVVKLPVDDTGRPFNPNDPLKQYGKPKKDEGIMSQYKTIDDEVTQAEKDAVLDSFLASADRTYANFVTKAMKDIQKASKLEQEQMIKAISERSGMFRYLDDADADKIIKSADTSKPLIDLSKYDDAALNALAEEGNKIKIQLEKLGESGTNYGEFKKLSARKKEIDDILSAAQDVPVSGYDNFKADLSLQKQTTKNKPGFDISKDPPKGFQTEKFIRDFPVTREEAERIAKLPNEERKKILKQYIDEDTNRQLTLLEYDVTDRKPNAKGGIAEFYTGGMVDVEPNLSDIGHGSDALMARTRLMSPNSQATTSTGLNYLLAEDNDNIRVPFENGGDFRQFQKEKMMQLMKEYEQYLKNREIEKRQRPYIEQRMGTGPGPILEAAEGGRIGFSNGGNGEDDSLQGIMMTIEERQKNLRKLLQQLEDLKKGKGIDPDPEEKAGGGRIGFSEGNGVADEETTNAKFAKRVRQLMDEGFDMGEAVREAMKEGYAEGGRIGFSKGKLADIARRQFMKVAGAGAAGLAALKTGLLGFGKGAAPVATEAVKSAGSTAPPPYFFKLMEKIKFMGNKRTTPSYKERVNEYTYRGQDGSEYELIEDLDTGNMKITKDKIGGRSYGDESVEVIEDRTEMVFRKGQMDETTKGKKPSDEYEEYKVEFDQDGTAADATDIDEISKMEIVEEAGDPDSLTLKKAGGGPITATKIPLKPAVKDINKKGQPYTTMYSLGGIAKLLGE